MTTRVMAPLIADFRWGRIEDSTGRGVDLVLNVRARAVGSFGLRRV